MTYQNPNISSTAELLRERLQSLAIKENILKAVELKSLYAEIPTLPAEERGAYGRELNQLKQELIDLVETHKEQAEVVPPIDVTAPFDSNVPADRRPYLLGSEAGSQHPLMMERDIILDIFYRMGFTASESREIDDDYHMFGSLNFPEGHPARDDYDTFMTEQTDTSGKRFIAPAHTSTMQNRILQQYAAGLETGKPIAVVIPDRIFRNEDVDARHEHTFYQIEGVYVNKAVNAGHLMATLKTWLNSYYGREIEIKTQPFYFPFTEPSFEFAASCIFCDGKGCNVCSHTGWIELGGCGMIHPNVLTKAGIDSEKFTGFAWGFGLDRLVMLKHNIEDVRHFHNGKLSFLRQFA